ncbi:hypothetical protein, partial [Photobacterium sp. R1]
MADGTLVLSILPSGDQPAGNRNVNVTVEVTQFAPLDHLSGGSDTGLVRVNGAEIRINAPIQLQDVDGDSLPVPVNS